MEIPKPFFMSENRLNSVEWIVVSFFSLSVIFLSLYTHFSAYEERIDLLPYPDKPIIVLEVSGEVEKPGRYNVKKGIQMKDLLEMVKPTLSADLSKIDLKAEIETSRVVKISRKRSTKKTSKKR